MYDENVINLTKVHPWMTFEEAWLLMKWSYVKNKPGEHYGTLKVLMGIDFGMFQYKPESWVREKINEAKKMFNYND